MNVKQTYHFQDGASSSHHLYVVIAVDYPNDRIAVVNFTTIRSSRHDKSCALAVGDHPFIKVPSYALYSHAVVASDRHITSISAGMLGIPVSDLLLQRLQQGALTSQYTEPQVVELVQNYIASNLRESTD